MAASSLKLLFDENFSHRQVDFVAKESRLADFQHIRPLGWSGQADSIWIPRAVRAGFCIVTWDRNERTRGFTVADLKSMQATVVLVGEFFDHMSGWERAKWLVARIEGVVTIAGALSAGSVVMVDRSGKARSL